MVGTNRSRI